MAEFPPTPWTSDPYLSDPPHRQTKALPQSWSPRGPTKASQIDSPPAARPSQRNSQRRRQLRICRTPAPGPCARRRRPPSSSRACTRPSPTSTEWQARRGKDLQPRQTMPCTCAIVKSTFRHEGRTCFRNPNRCLLQLGPIRPTSQSVERIRRKSTKHCPESAKKTTNSLDVGEKKARRRPIRATNGLGSNRPNCRPQKWPSLGPTLARNRPISWSGIDHDWSGLGQIGSEFSRRGPHVGKTFDRNRKKQANIEPKPRLGRTKLKRGQTGPNLADRQRIVSVPPPAFRRLSRRRLAQRNQIEPKSGQVWLNWSNVGHVKEIGFPLDGVPLCAPEPSASAGNAIGPSAQRACTIRHHGGPRHCTWGLRSGIFGIAWLHQQ